MALVELFQDCLQEIDAFFTCRLRVRLERGLRCGDGFIYISRRAQADTPVSLFGRRINNVQGTRFNRVNPLAIDIEL